MESEQKIAKETLIFSDALTRRSVPRLSGNFREVERQILNLLARKEYQNIQAILSPIRAEVKESFFKKNGYSILHYAVTRSRDTEALKLIVENTPVTIVQGLLRNNNSEILKDLVGIQYSIETYTIPGQTEMQEAQESALVSQKLAFLSKIDNELLADFLENHKEEEYMSETVIQMVEAQIPTETQRPSYSLSAE